MFKCVQPLHLGLKDVPCGHCYNCQMRKRAEWDFRLTIESMSNSCYSSAFVTLTYDNDHLVEVEDSKRLLTLYFKQLRNNGYKFRYYCVTEFGERSGRLHHHVIFFFLEPTNPLTLYHSWKYGHMDVGKISSASIHYVTKWHVHPKYDRDHPKEKHGFHPCQQVFRCELSDFADFGEFSCGCQVEW